MPVVDEKVRAPRSIYRRQEVRQKAKFWLFCRVGPYGPFPPLKALRLPSEHRL